MVTRILLSALAALVLCRHGAQSGMIYTLNLEDINVPNTSPLHEAASASFIHIHNGSLRGMENLKVFPNVGRDECAKNCVLNSMCKSFDFDTLNKRCYLFSVDATTNNYVRKNKRREYYQLIPRSGEIIVVKGVSIKKRGRISRFQDISIKQCIARCQQLPGCLMFEYKEEHRRCDLTNIIYTDHNLAPNFYGWDYYSMNDVKIENYFLKVLHGALKGSRFYSSLKDVPVEQCASKCMGESRCKSFEYNTAKKTCYLSVDDASQKKKLWVNYKQEFYQLEKERGVMNMIQGASIPGHDFFPRIKAANLELCLASCRHTPGCRSIEFKESKCDRTNVTHSGHPLKASLWGWNFVEINGAPEENEMASLK